MTSQIQSKSVMLVMPLLRDARRYMFTSLTLRSLVLLLRRYPLLCLNTHSATSTLLRHRIVVLSSMKFLEKAASALPGLGYMLFVELTLLAI